jgi:hypothetical protein
MPKGDKVYEIIHNGISIDGICYTASHVEASVIHVANKCYDSEGIALFDKFAKSVSSTGFSPVSFMQMRILDWQVGEGFAEAYLSSHFSCRFPWSSNRDLKNPKSSLSGADMVGYCNGEFAFGEVKTSSESKYPPQVTSKKDGLNSQLNTLCSDPQLRLTLVHYLFHREMDKTEYIDAFKCYMNDMSSFYIFGVLVRDVLPKIRDWEYLKKYLKPHKPEKVSLVALYLPPDHGISKLHSSVVERRKTHANL